MKVVRSRGYGRWKRTMGYVYIGAGVLLIAQVTTRAHSVAEMVPGLLLGGAFVALGFVRLRSIPA